MRIVAVSFILFLLTVTQQIRAQSGLNLWYDKPAEAWVEALSVGNGHIGGMGADRAIINFRKNGEWAGSCPAGKTFGGIDIC